MTITQENLDFSEMITGIKFLVDTVKKNIEASPTLKAEKEELKLKIYEIEKHIDSFVTYQNVINERVNHLTNISKERFRQMFDGFIRTSRDLEKIFEQSEKIHTQNKKILEWIEKQKTIEEPKEETVKYLPPIPPLIKNEETRPLLQPKPIDQFFSSSPPPKKEPVITAPVTPKSVVKIYRGEQINEYTTVRKMRVSAKGVDHPKDAYEWTLSFKLNEVMAVHKRPVTNDQKPRWRFFRSIINVEEAEKIRYVIKEFLQNPTNKPIKQIGLYLKLYDADYEYKGERKLHEDYLKLSRKEMAVLHDKILTAEKSSDFVIFKGEEK